MSTVGDWAVNIYESSKTVHVLGYKAPDMSLMFEEPILVFMSNAEIKLLYIVLIVHLPWSIALFLCAPTMAGCARLLDVQFIARGYSIKRDFLV